MKTRLIMFAAFAAALLMSSCTKESSGEYNKSKDVTESELTEDRQEEETAEIAEVGEDNEKADVERPSFLPNWMPDNVKLTPSGLGLVIENEGDDTRANPTSRVTLHYRGRLLNGTEFDSSYERGVPATFMPVQVVPGFGEGIQLLGIGGKATLYIPSDLAYGSRGIPQAGIAPNSNLIFDIEIIDITD